MCMYMRIYLHVYIYIYIYTYIYIYIHTHTYHISSARRSQATSGSPFGWTALGAEQLRLYCISAVCYALVLIV